MRKLVDQPEWQSSTVDFYLQPGCRYFFRDVQKTIEYILQQRAYQEHLVYEPIHELDAHGNRLYSDMHTGDWWWKTQVFFLPLRYASTDTDHLQDDAPGRLNSHPRPSDV